MKKNKGVLVNKPKGWRQGQTIFNFLQWLGEYGFAPITNTERLSDTFHIQDDEFYNLYEKYMKEVNNTKKT